MPGCMKFLDAEIKVKANMKDYKQHYNTGLKFEQSVRGLVPGGTEYTAGLKVELGDATS